MDKLAVEISKGMEVGGIVVLNSEYKNLGCVLEMRAVINDSTLYKKLERPIFADKLDELAATNSYVYFTISNIQNLDERQQEKYVSLLEDRNFYGYKLPKNVVVVFTVDSKEDIKKICQRLYDVLTIAI